MSVPGSSDTPGKHHAFQDMWDGIPAACQSPDECEHPRCRCRFLPAGSLDEQDTPQEASGDDARVVRGTVAVSVDGETKCVRCQHKAGLHRFNGVRDDGSAIIGSCLYCDCETFVAPVDFGWGVGDEHGISLGPPGTKPPVREPEAWLCPYCATPLTATRSFSTGVCPTHGIQHAGAEAPTPYPGAACGDSQDVARPAGYTETDSAREWLQRFLHPQTGWGVAWTNAQHARALLDALDALVARLAAEEARRQELEQLLGGSASGASGTDATCRERGRHYYGMDGTCVRCGEVSEPGGLEADSAVAEVSLRAKAERPVVYPLNRDECLALIDALERLVAAVNTENFNRVGGRGMSQNLRAALTQAVMVADGTPPGSAGLPTGSTPGGVV